MNKHCNLHKLLRRPSWSEKQSPIKPPHYKLSLIWMLFSLEYRKCLFSHLGPHVAFFIDSTMKDVIGLYYWSSIFIVSKDMKGLDRLIMQGMHIADRIVAIFFNIAKFINKRPHYNFKSCVCAHDTRTMWVLVGFCTCLPHSSQCHS